MITFYYIHEQDFDLNTRNDFPNVCSLVKPAKGQCRMRGIRCTCVCMYEYEERNKLTQQETDRAVCDFCELELR